MLRFLDYRFFCWEKEPAKANPLSSSGILVGGRLDVWVLSGYVSEVIWRELMWICRMGVANDDRF